MKSAALFLLDKNTGKAFIYAVLWSFVSLLFSYIYGIICTRETYRQTKTKHAQEKAEVFKMDYCFIGNMAGPDIAEKIKSDHVFEDVAAAGQPIGANLLDALTRGGVILGIDPVNYPLTDGLYVYIKEPNGDILTLFIESDPLDPSGEVFQCLRISGAAIAREA